MCISVKNWKSEYHHWVLHISLSTKFQLKLTILIFWTKFVKIAYFWSKTEKSKQGHWIMHIWINLGTKFQLRLTFYVFGPNFLKKGISGRKQKEVNIVIDFSYSNKPTYQFSPLKINFELRDQIFRRRGSPVENGKSEYQLNSTSSS